MKKSRLLLISAGAGAALAAVIWLTPWAVKLWGLLPSEAKIAFMAAVVTALAISVFFSVRMIHRTTVQRKPARALIQALGTAGDNILRREKVLFPESELNEEIAQYVVGMSGVPVEEGELSAAAHAKTWSEWPGFPVYAVEVAGGQNSVKAAEAIRKVEIDDYFRLGQKVCITANPALNTTVLGNGITGISSALIFPWEQVSGTRTQILWVISDKEKEPDKDPDSKDNDNHDNGSSGVHVESKEYQFAEDIGGALGTAFGRVLETSSLEEALSLPEEKLSYMGKISAKCATNRVVVVLSENLPDRGLDNQMKKRALLTMALTAAEEKHDGILLGGETSSSIGASDVYHIARYPGIYTHSELRRVTGLNGIMAMVEDLRKGNIVWHLQSFRKDPSLWAKRGVFMAFIIGNSSLVSGAVQSLGSAVPATPVLVTHSVPGASSAYILLLARLCEKEVAESPFSTFRWEQPEEKDQRRYSDEKAFAGYGKRVF